MIEWRPITDRSTWLRWRQDYLTASDVAAAAGRSKFKSRAKLFAEKVDGAPASKENGAMKRGRLSEGTALEYLREEKPTWLIARPNVFITNAETRLACTPDAVVTDPARPGTINCQIKTIARPSFDRWDGVPLDYILQVACENMLLDAAAGVLCVLVVGTYEDELKLFDIPRHARTEAAIIQIAASFWDDVAAGRRPQPDFTRDADLIAEMFPRPDPAKTIDLSTDNRILEILPLRETLKDTIDGARKELEGLDAEVKFKLGDAEVAELPGWRLTWKLEERKAYTVEASERRVLRVKQIEAA